MNTTIRNVPSSFIRRCASISRSAAGAMLLAGLSLLSISATAPYAHALPPFWIVNGSAANSVTAGDDTITTDAAFTFYDPLVSDAGAVFGGNDSLLFAAGKQNNAAVAGDFITFGAGTSSAIINGNAILTGVGADGIFMDGAGLLTVIVGSTGSITTTGVGGNAIETNLADLVLINSGLLTTMADAAPAVDVAGSLNYTDAMGSTVLTTGNNGSNALQAGGNIGGTVMGEISTIGADSHAIFTSAGDVGNNMTPFSNLGAIRAIGASSDAINAVNVFLSNQGMISASGFQGNAIHSVGGDVRVTSNSGTIEAAGDEGHAIFAVGGNATIVNNSGIITSSGNGTGIEGTITASGNVTILNNTSAGTIDASGDDTAAVMSTGGNVILMTNAGFINTLGDGSAAIRTLFLGGDILIGTNTATGQINTLGTTSGLGNEAHAIDSAGMITFTSNQGIVATVSDFANAMIAVEDINLLSNSGTVQTGIFGFSGNQAHVIHSITGDVNVTNEADGVIQTFGPNSIALWAEDATGDIRLTNEGQVHAYDAGSTTLLAGNSIFLVNHDGGDIITELSANAIDAGILVDFENTNGSSIITKGGGVAINAGDDIIGLNDDALIQTEGADSDAIFSDNTISSLTNQNGGEIHALADRSDAIESTSNANIVNQTGALIETLGDGSRGINCGEDLTLDLLSGASIETAGDVDGVASDAVFSSGNADIEIDDASIKTTGLAANGILCGGELLLSMTNGARIDTFGDNDAGDRAIGVESVGAADILLDASTIQTRGGGAHGIYAQDALDLDLLNGSLIQVEGDFARGVVCDLDANILNQNSTIVTHGNDAEGISVGGVIDLTNGDDVNTASILASGTDSRGVEVFGGGTILNDCMGEIITTGAGESQAIFATGGAGTTVENRGYISSSSTTSPAIEYSGNFDDVFINKGCDLVPATVISGSDYAVRMGDGDDNAHIYQGVFFENGQWVDHNSHIEGIIDGGPENAADTFNFHFLIACPDDIQQWKDDFANGGQVTITLWGETFVIEEFENLNLVGIDPTDCLKTPNQIEVFSGFLCFDGYPNQDLKDFLIFVASLPCDLYPELANELSPQRYELLSKIAFANTDFHRHHFDSRAAALREGAYGIDSSRLSMLDATLDPTFARMMPMLAANTVSSSKETTDSATQSTDTAGSSTQIAGRSEKSVTAPYFDSDKRWGCFISGSAILADGEGTPDLFDYEWNTASLVMGADYTFTRDMGVIAAGPMIAFAHTDADLDNLGSEADIDSYTFGAYATWSLNNFYLNASVFYTFNDYEFERHIPLLDSVVHGDTTGSQYTGILSGGYDFRFGRFTVGPTAALQYVNWNADGFQEHGGGIEELTVAQDETDSLRASLGGRATYTFAMGRSFALTPEFRASYYHEFLDDNRGITAKFNNPQLHPFTVQTTDPERDWAEVGGSVRARFNDTVSAFIDYDAQVFRDDFFAHSVNGGLRLDF